MNNLETSTDNNAPFAVGYMGIILNFLTSQDAPFFNKFFRLTWLIQIEPFENPITSKV
jgi:hypothetical protein